MRMLRTHVHGTVIGSSDIGRALLSLFREALDIFERTKGRFWALIQDLDW